MNEFVALPTLATIAGVSRQALEKALRKIIRGEAQSWRGAAIQFRHVCGRGGRAGLNYEIRVDSLPPFLQQPVKDHLNRPTPVQIGELTDHRGAERNWYLRVLGPLLAMKPGRERAAAIEALAARADLTDWRGQPITLSARTIHRRLKAYHDDGALAFAPRARRDKGEIRVAVSKPWDAAVSGALDMVSRSFIANELRGYIRGLIAKDTSRKVIEATLAPARLRELTILAGMEGASTLPADLFKLPRRFIDREKKYRNVAIFDKDRKAYEDAKPRILRTREGLPPMDIIVGDVHHIDIVMRRPDGSEAWPKAIAWLDLATNRIWLTLVLLEKGEGIRNADVISSFVDMVTAWGMPRSLYLDNGSEYRWPEFIDDALKLVARIDCNFEDRESQVIRAKPYNAPAKAIEGIFGVLEKSYFRTLPGWAGGDRTNKKTHQVGQSTEPFPGTLADLARAIGNCLAIYEISRQDGTLKGRSPREAYDAAVAAGWQRVAIDARELHAVFAMDVLRVPDRGHIAFGGDKWTCRELQAFLGDRVIVRVPKFRQPSMLPLLDPATRKIIGYAEPAKRFGILDPAGAREAATMDKTRRTAIRELRASAPDIDPNAEIARVAATIPAAASAPILATIGISDEAAEIARGIAEPPVEREQREQKARKVRAAKAVATYAPRDRSIFK